MITSKNIDDAIHFDIERNIYKDAKELTERYLMNRLGLSLAMESNLEKRDPQNKTYCCHFHPTNLIKYLYENTVTHAHFEKTTLEDMLNDIAVDAKKNNIEIRYGILRNGFYGVSFTKIK